MTPLPRHLPGALLLRVARLLFVERIVRSTIEPAIADFQHELRTGGDGPGRRLLVRARGYLAFWKLVALVPFMEAGLVHGPAGATPAVPADPDDSTLVLATVLSVPLVAIVYVAFGSVVFGLLIAGVVTACLMHAWHSHRLDRERSPGPSSDLRFAAIPTPGSTAGLFAVTGSVVLFVAAWIPWMAVVLAAAAGVVAVTTHAWYARHPVQVATERRGAPRHPEINFAAIQVMENMAGLLVVVGGVTVIAAGLSAFRWFLLAAIASGLLVAVVLCRWRANHPPSRRIENSIASH